MIGSQVIIFTAVIVLAAFAQTSSGRRRAKADDKNSGPYHNKAIIVRSPSGKCTVHETITDTTTKETDCKEMQKKFPQHFYSFFYGCYYVDGDNYYKAWPGYCEFGLRRAVIIENNCLRAKFSRRAGVRKTRRSVIRCKTEYRANSTKAQRQYFSLEYLEKFNEDEQMCIKKLESVSSTYEQPMLITCNEFSAENWKKGMCRQFAYSTMGGQYSFSRECSKIQHKDPNEEDKQQIGNRFFAGYKNPYHAKSVIFPQKKDDMYCMVYDQLRNDVRFNEWCSQLRDQLPMYFEITTKSECIFAQQYSYDRFKAWPGYCELGSYRAAYKGNQCEKVSVVRQNVRSLKRPTSKICKEDYTYDTSRTVEGFHILELAGKLNEDYVCMMTNESLNQLLMICNSVIKRDPDKVKNWAPKMCHAFYTSADGTRRSVTGNCINLETVIYDLPNNPTVVDIEAKLREYKFI